MTLIVLDNMRVFPGIYRKTTAINDRGQVRARFVKRRVHFNLFTSQPFALKPT